MYRWLVEERTTLHSIQSKLNALAIPTKYDNLGKNKPVNGASYWKKRTIGRILSNEVYTGEFTYNKTLQPYHKKLKKYEGLTLRPKEEWITIKTPRLISKELFNLAQEQLGKNRSFSDRNQKRHYLFTGLFECGVCGGKYGSSYDAARKHKEESHRKRYFCNNSRTSIRQTVCKTPSVTESRLEEPVWDKLVQLLSNPQLAFEQLERIQKKNLSDNGFKEKIEDLVAIIEKKRLALNKLLDLYLNNGIPKELYETKAKMIEAELQSHSNELAGYKNQIISEKEQELRVSSIQNMYAKFKDNLAKISYENKREVLRMLVEKAVIKGKEIDVHCAIPYEFAFAGQAMNISPCKTKPRKKLILKIGAWPPVTKTSTTIRLPKTCGSSRAKSSKSLAFPLNSR
jgi:site-specific DNA recombinase